MRRRTLLAGLAVGLAGCSGGDEPAATTTNRATTTRQTTVRDIQTTPERTEATPERTESPTETTDEPAETVVVGPGDDVELHQGPVRLGEFVEARANFFASGSVSGYIRGGEDRIYGVLDADLSAYDSQHIIAGSQFEVTVSGDPIRLEYSDLGVQFGESRDERTAQFAVPLPTLDHSPPAASVWFYGPDRSYRYPLPDHILSAMGHDRALSVATSFPEVISASDDSAEVEVEFLVRNDGDRPWILTCVVDHDRIEDGGWPVQLTVPPGEQRRGSESVWVSLRDAQEVTFEATWGFGGTEKTVPIERER